MRRALAGDGATVAPSPRGRAQCPGCGGTVIAKCGELTAWHWAHAVGSDCDSWSSEMTAWHLGWQDRFPAEMREVWMGANREHRADVRCGNTVLEIQSRPSYGDILEREAFYTRRAPMIWVFDAREPYAAGRIRLRVKRGRTGREYVAYKWMHAWRSIAASTETVYLQLDDDRLLRVAGAFNDFATGWGHIVRPEAVVREVWTGTRGRLAVPSWIGVYSPEVDRARGDEALARLIAAKTGDVRAIRHVPAALAPAPVAAGQYPPPPASWASGEPAWHRWCVANGWVMADAA